MYSMVKDTYTCDTCGFEEKWDAHDDHRGDIWECECCGAHFCTECFVKKFGRESFDKMLKEAGHITCVDCYKKDDFGESNHTPLQQEGGEKRGWQYCKS